jgi:CRP-like cAMP-binding protein
LELIKLQANQALFRYGDALDYTYFPLTAVASLLSLLAGGKSVEIGLVGREGVIGLPTMLGPSSAIYAAEVLVPGQALRVRAEALRKYYVMNDPLCRQLIQHSWSLSTQFSRLAVCNLCHHIPARVSRWLLMLQDRAVVDEFQLTHEQIATRLGIRRSGVTVQLGQLEEAGAIRAARGRIRITDRSKLEEVSCECYRYLVAESEWAYVQPSAPKPSVKTPSQYWPRQVEYSNAVLYS